MVVYTPLVPVNFPANAAMVFKFLVEISSFELLPTE
jgi:hypothetical protein